LAALNGEPLEAHFGRVFREVLPELAESHEASIRGVMARLLGRRGHRVTTSASFEEALREADSDVFDLVISDIGLPDGSGLDLMRRLRPRVALGGIALSGVGMDEDIRRSGQAGFVAHLTRPVDFARLEAAIRRVALEGGIGAATE
jgi:DNA-binding response OmpR family regulator